MKQRYDSYKPSGIDWIGDIPEHWTKCRFKNFMFLKTSPSCSSVKIGLENLESGSGKFIESDTEFDGNGIEFCKNDILYGKLRPYLRKVWLAEFSGNAVGDFFVFHNRQNSSAAYLKYVLLSDGFTKQADGSTFGAKMPRVSSEFILTLPICLPPLSEQESIAAWLDARCGEIDAAIAKVDREIELIDELKQSEISRAVTRGLNPDAPLRPSGIDWIGDIPEHWKIVPIKSLGFFTKGLTFTKADLADEGKSVISYGQIHSKLNDKVGIRRELIRYIPDRICLNNASSLTKKGDFIFADTSEDLQGCGNAVYNDTLIPLYGGYHTIILHSFSEDNKYFGYLFLTDAWRSQIRASVSGVKVYSITQSILKNCNILVPPLSEQQAIADYLDKKCAEIDGLKAKLTKKRETLTELRQSIISEVVTGKRRVAACRDRSIDNIDRDGHIGHIDRDDDHNGRDRSRPYRDRHIDHIDRNIGHNGRDDDNNGHDDGHNGRDRSRPYRDRNIGHNDRDDDNNGHDDGHNGRDRSRPYRDPKNNN